MLLQHQLVTENFFFQFQKILTQHSFLANTIQGNGLLGTPPQSLMNVNVPSSPLLTPNGSNNQINNSNNMQNSNSNLLASLLGSNANNLVSLLQLQNQNVSPILQLLTNSLKVCTFIILFKKYFKFEFF